MSEHTKLRVNRHGYEATYIYHQCIEDEAGSPVCAVWCPDGNAEQEHATRRLVASWNALAGIPTESLEAGLVREMAEALRLVLKGGSCADWSRAMDAARAVLAKLPKEFTA